jgi:uncharacterized delta-60 repeat protein
MKLQIFGSHFTRHLLFSFCVLLGISVNALALSGDLDTTFGSNGKVVSPIGKFSADYGNATALQSDGKIIVVGRSIDGNYTNLLVARINTDGSLDNSFGNKGSVLKRLFNNGYALAVIVQPNGKIVAGGFAQTNAYYSVFTLVRFNSDGSVDNAFGTNGIAQAQFGRDNSLLTSLAIQADGKIVAAGYTYTNYSFQPNNFAVARFNTNGTLDNTFGSGGMVNLAFSFNSTKANSVITQPDGKILVGGFAGSFFQLIRLNTDGALDTSFDSDGIVSTRIGTTSGIAALALQTDGKIVAAGSSSDGTTNSDIAVARYNSNGSLDNTFDSDGIVVTDVENRQEGASDVNIQADGKITVSGTTGQSNSTATRSFLAVRYNPNGALDTTFDNDGKAVTDVSPTDEQANAMVTQPDGKVVLVGYSFSTNFDIALVRYNTDGSLDNSFNNDGISLIELGNSIDIILDTAIQADGKIIAVGYSFNGVFRDITVVRYNPNGTFDDSFGNNGVVTTSLGRTASDARSVRVQADGKIVIGGNINAFGTQSSFAVLRYKSDGSLDDSFGNSGIVTFRVGANTGNLQDIALQNEDCRGWKCVVDDRL